MRRRYPRAALPALVVAAALAVASCGPDGPPPLDRNTLVALVAPPLDRLEPGVRAQLEASRQRVQSLRADERSERSALGSAYAELGRQYHSYELFEAAIPCYLNAQALLPDDYRWPYYLGRAYSSLGRGEEARDALERTLALSPDDVPARVALGRTYLASANFDRAEAEALRALEADPGAAGALLLLGELAAERGDASAAVARYETLLEEQPGATRLYKPLALAYRGTGRLDDARRALALAGEGPVRTSDPLMQALRPRVAGALPFRQAGVAAFQRGDFETAELQFRRAIAEGPDYEGDRLNLGSTLTELGRLDEAAEQMREVLAMNPRHALAHYNLGVILDATGRRAEAIEAYRESIRLDAGSYRPRFNLATALREEGRCDVAMEEYAQILDDFPGDKSARVGESLCLIDQGRFTEARARLDDALRTSSGDAWVTYVTSRLLAASPHDALRDGSRALELSLSLLASGRSPEYLETRAMALAELEQFDEAIASQNEAIALAESQGRGDRLPRLRRNLARYADGRPARDPALE